MKRFCLIVLCVFAVGCDQDWRLPCQKMQTTHDPPPATKCVAPVEKSSNQKLEDVVQLIKKLEIDRETLIRTFEAKGFKSIEDLGKDEVARYLASELHQVDVCIKKAKKEAEYLRHVVNQDVFEAHRKAREDEVKKFIDAPTLPEEGIARSLSQQEAAEIAVKDIEKWHKKIDGEIKQRAKETPRVELPKLQPIKPKPIKAVVQQRDVWAEWWKNYVQKHRSHSCDCTVYCCQSHNEFWSYCYAAVHEMFPNEKVYTRNGGGYQVVFTHPIAIYSSSSGWGFIPNAYHGAWCQYHSRYTPQNPQITIIYNHDIAKESFRSSKLR
ncbi:MAG: hypothetical protein M0R80_02505 [Proteobacteria bacterium]|jgi:hypothetical protein|nr:hypothetical protein [Pseudomonadota bacterium]